VAGIESWVPMLVLPFGFGLLAVRFVLSAFAPRPIDEPAP
jgi:TRAP-type C4-dicarboxylate transport system permease small subunit